jgi:polyribonucleotide nucleotidyltransferase
VEFGIFTFPIPNYKSKRRIFWSMSLAVGQIVEGKVTGLTNFGAFVELPNGQTLTRDNPIYVEVRTRKEEAAVAAELRVCR